MTEYGELLGCIKSLEKKLDQLSHRAEIENLVSTYQSYLSAGLGARIVGELWAQNTEDVAIELGASGVYIGPRKVSTYYEKDIVPGRYAIHAMTTPSIDVCSDKNYAHGVWTSVGLELDAGELGICPPKSSQERALLTSVSDDGRAFKAEWLWQKFDADFLLEDSKWKIWHLHCCELIRAPFDQNPVTFANRRFDTDGLRIDAAFTSNIPYPPGAPPENNAVKETSSHWQYSAEALPELIPGGHS